MRTRVTLLRPGMLVRMNCASFVMLYDGPDDTYENASIRMPVARAHKDELGMVISAAEVDGINVANRNILVLVGQKLGWVSDIWVERVEFSELSANS